MKYFLPVLMIAAIACNQQPKSVSSDTIHTAMTVASENEIQYDTAIVDNRRDPVCKMPVKAGIFDTAHYQGKVIGFCSSSCKDSFLTDPARYTLVMKH